MVFKVVLVGAKKYAHLVTAFERVYPSLLEFRKRDAHLPLSDAPHDLDALDDTSIHHLLLETRDPNTNS